MSEVNESHMTSIRLSKSWLFVGAIVCLSSVLIGAFAAHALKAILTDYQIGIVDTAAKYQMYHGLALLIATIVLSLLGSSTKLLSLVNSSFAIGCLLFSGSLYCLALTNQRVIAYLTPIGGVFFISGWCLFLWAIFKSPKQKKRCI